MFKHQGKSRNLLHNIRIAIVLSFVAGIVNITGYLSIKQLTTNVTGHFAHFINDISILEIWKGIMYLLYIASFLTGSFCSSALFEYANDHKKLNVYVLPTFLESFTLISVAILYDLEVQIPSNVIACLLLFAMGVQNSFVTKISNAVVRTTHLTGLFTDLGIELSQLLFPKKYPNLSKIKASIRLRIYIICFFFSGGILAGYLYSKLGINNLYLAASILIIGLIYDNLRFRMLRAKRKYKNRKIVVLN